MKKSERENFLQNGVTKMCIIANVYRIKIIAIMNYKNYSKI